MLNSSRIFSKVPDCVQDFPRLGGITGPSNGKNRTDINYRGPVENLGSKKTRGQGKPALVLETPAKY